MASRQLTDAVDEHDSHQLSVRKTRKREFSGAEIALFNEAKKIRKTSAELIAAVEKLEAEEASANTVEQIWKKRMGILESLMQRTIIVLKLNDEAHENGDIDSESYRKTILNVSQLRKICVDAQIHLSSKKLDITTFKDDLILVPKEYHQEMASLLLSSFVAVQHRASTKGSLGLTLKNRFGRTVKWRNHLASEYRGSHMAQQLDEASTDVEVKVEKHDDLWDPIVGAWVPQDKVKAAHIVARSERDAYIRFLFGVEDHADFLMDARNGLIMASSLEEAFDRGEFIIVPAGGVDESGCIKLQCLVLRYTNLQQKGGKKMIIFRMARGGLELTWDDLHERVLTFPKGCKLRPYRRCLFHHAIGAVIHCRQLRFKGWEEIWANFFSGNMWATPEKYLERSLLQGTWDLLVGEEMPLSLEKFSFLGIGDTSRVDSQMWASEVMGQIDKEDEKDRKEGEEEDEEED